MPGGSAMRSTSAERQQSFVTVSGNVTRLGSTIAMDGTASWAPRLPGRFQPVNAYALALPDETLMIDTGLAAHRSDVLDQIDAATPRDRPLAVFLTRAEPECAGNAGQLGQVREVREIIAAAFRPFDAYEEGISSSIKVTALTTRLSKNIPLGARPGLTVIATRMRLLSTVWVHDATTRTLFSSDFFGHTTIDSPDAPVTIDSLANDATTYESARAHLITKFWWVPLAKTQPLIDDIEDTFRTLDIENIAPTHGCILRGREVVQKHLDLVLRTLRDVPRERAGDAA